MIAVAVSLGAIALALLGVVRIARDRVPEAAVMNPAARTIERLLEVRAEASADASAYAGFFSSPSLALALASDEEEREDDRSPIPKWREPYASALATPSARVVVRWKKERRFEDWPVATVFGLTYVNGRWLIEDASTVAQGGEIPPPAR